MRRIVLAVLLCFCGLGVAVAQEPAPAKKEKGAAGRAFRKLAKKKAPKQAESGAAPAGANAAPAPAGGAASKAQAGPSPWSRTKAKAAAKPAPQAAPGPASGAKAAEPAPASVPGASAAAARAGEAAPAAASGKKGPPAGKAAPAAAAKAKVKAKKVKKAKAKKGKSESAPGRKAAPAPAKGKTSARPAPKTAPATADKGRKVPRNHLTVRNVNTGERVENLRFLETDPKNKKRQLITRNARRQMARLLRDTRTKRQASPPDRLLWMVYQAAQHFDAQVTIISGLRQSARRTSRHYRSHAVDLRLEGVEPARVWAFCKRLKKVGCGYYPKSGFVHMDLRDKSYSWVEESDSGEGAVAPESVSQAAPPAGE